MVTSLCHSSRKPRARAVLASRPVRKPRQPDGGAEAATRPWRARPPPPTRSVLCSRHGKNRVECQRLLEHPAFDLVRSARAARRKRAGAIGDSLGNARHHRRRASRPLPRKPSRAKAMPRSSKAASSARCAALPIMKHIVSPSRSPMWRARDASGTISTKRSTKTGGQSARDRPRGRGPPRRCRSGTRGRTCRRAPPRNPRLRRAGGIPCPGGPEQGNRGGTAKIDCQSRNAGPGRGGDAGLAFRTASHALLRPHAVEDGAGLEALCGHGRKGRADADGKSLFSAPCAPVQAVPSGL